MFRGCKVDEMPPHIYSLTQSAYRTMLETRRDQSIIFIGRSGAGKTSCFKHALYYLTLASGKFHGPFVVSMLECVEKSMFENVCVLGICSKIFSFQLFIIKTMCSENKFSAHKKLLKIST